MHFHSSIPPAWSEIGFGFVPTTETRDRFIGRAWFASQRVARGRCASVKRRSYHDCNARPDLVTPIALRTVRSDGNALGRRHATFPRLHKGTD